MGPPEAATEGGVREGDGLFQAPPPVTPLTRPHLAAQSALNFLGLIS